VADERPQEDDARLASDGVHHGGIGGLRQHRHTDQNARRSAAAYVLYARAVQQLLTVRCTTLNAGLDRTA
jgi:hypothetical protein